MMIEPDLTVGQLLLCCLVGLALAGLATIFVACLTSSGAARKRRLKITLLALEAAVIALMLMAAARLLEDRRGAEADTETLRAVPSASVPVIGRVLDVIASDADGQLIDTSGLRDELAAFGEVDLAGWGEIVRTPDDAYDYWVYLYTTTGNYEVYFMRDGSLRLYEMQGAGRGWQLAGPES